jgi:hypothetical protein
MIRLCDEGCCHAEAHCCGGVAHGHENGTVCRVLMKAGATQKRAAVGVLLTDTKMALCAGFHGLPMLLHTSANAQWFPLYDNAGQRKVDIYMRFGVSK